jgi:branched-chain amino acid transport system substrate-binding protein
VKRRAAIIALGASAAPLFGRPARGQGASLKIGVVTSYSGGDNVALGKQFDAAIATWMRQHGDVAGGRKIELVKRDDGGIAPDLVRRLAQELIVQEKVDLLLGAIYTPNAIAMAAVSTQAKKPYFIANAATSNIVAKNPYSVRLGITTPQLTIPYAKWAYKQGIRTAFAMYQDYGPGIDAGKAFETTFEASGGKIVGETRIPLSNVDFAAYLQRVRDVRPQGAYIFVNATGGGLQLLKALHETGIDKQVKILASGDIVDEPLLEAEGVGDFAVGLTSIFSYSSWHPTRLNADFVRAFKPNYTGGGNGLPDFIGVQTYDAMNAIYRVVNAQKGQVDPDRTMELLRDLQFESPRGPITITAKTRGILQPVYIRRTEKKNGGLQNIEIETLAPQHDPAEEAPPTS